MSYSEEITAEAAQHPTLGAEYFAARGAVERFLAHWQEEHAQQVAEAIIKPILETAQEKVNDAFRDFLLSDAEQNAEGEMRRMVENTVNALIGGQKWASLKYIESPYGDGQKVRETLARLHSDTIKDGRIADLEKQVERLEETIRLHRSH